MKALITLLALFPLTQAHAEYIPNRTRASAEAKLQVTKADGVYKNVREAEVVEFRTDGEGVTRYDVKLNGKVETFVIDKVQEESCGDRYVGRAKNEREGRGELRLFNFLSNLCEARNGEEGWTVEISRHDSDKGVQSTLELTGVPEYYMLSQDAE